MKLGKFDNTSSAVISRKIFFPVPVVTDRFVVTVVSGPIPLVFKMDIIGMDPDKKYATDPIFTPRMYQDCKLYSKMLLIVITISKISQNVTEKHP